MLLLAHQFAVLVLKGEVELNRRLAVCHYKHLINLQKHLFLALYKFVGLCLAVASQFHSELAQFTLKLSAECRCVVGDVSLGHHALRNNAVFCSKVGNSCECSAVAQRIAEQPVNHLVGHRLLASIYNSLKEKVRLLELIPKEEVNLRKAEIIEFIVGNDLRTEHVHASKEPASSTALLVGYTFY